MIAWPLLKSLPWTTASSVEFWLAMASTKSDRVPANVLPLTVTLPTALFDVVKSKLSLPPVALISPKVLLDAVSRSKVPLVLRTFTLAW
jgi:hypothetical protein